MPSFLSNKLRLKQLMAVSALAEHQNMHRAAEALNMTQSTVSKLLKDLEGTLSADLFIREPRGMKPTDLGLDVARFATDTLSRIDRFAEEFQIKIAGGHGLLVVGAIMGAAPDLVARAVAEMKAERPLLTVRLLGETSDHILEMLEAGALDVAVGRFSAARHWHLFDFEPLGEEPLELVVRSNHPLTQMPAPSLTELHGWPWVLQPQTTPARQLLDQAFSRIGLSTPVNYVESVSIFAILQLVQSSDAITLLPVSVVKDHLRAGLLMSLPDPIGQTIRGFGIMRKRNEALTEAAENFADRLRSIMR